MTKEAIFDPGEIDWSLVILEVQTAPEGAEFSPDFVRIYEAIFGFLMVNAKKWLLARNYSSAHDIDLASIGFDKALKEITKFDIPNSSSKQILRSFKAWAAICSRREWEKRVNLELTSFKSSYDETQCDQISSIEEDMITKEDIDILNVRPNTEKELKRKILSEELGNLPTDMRDALLETEDLKRIDNPNSRGLQGDSKQIAEKYGYTPGSIRTKRCRLLEKVKSRYEKERSK